MARGHRQDRSAQAERRRRRPGPLHPDNSPRHIAETRRYIHDFIRLSEETAIARELYDRMLALYPDRINPGSLWGSANAAKPTPQAIA